MVLLDRYKGLDITVWGFSEVVNIVKILKMQCWAVSHLRAASLRAWVRHTGVQLHLRAA
jgi:hypothetical protein